MTRSSSLMLVATLLPMPLASAATMTWDGGASTVNWSDNANWSGTPNDTAPTSADLAAFANNPTGTLATTVDALFAGTIQGLRINQSTTTAANHLTLARSLTLSNNAAMQYNTTSGVGTLSQADDFVVDLDGNALVYSAIVFNGSATQTFLGTYRFDTAGSAIRSNLGGGSPNTNSVTFNFGTSGGSPALIDVTADGVIEQSNGSTSTQNLGTFNVSLFSNATLSVSNNATLTVRKQVRSQNVDGADLNVTNSGSISVAANAALALERLNVSTSVSNAQRISDITFTNTGQVAHAGTLSALPEERGDTSWINSGTWTVTGSTAKLEDRRANVSGTIAPTFVNQAGGVIRGSSSADTLEFDATSAGLTTTQLNITNSGAVAPGAGTNQSGLSSVGALTLRDTNVAFTGTGALQIDVGGIGAGQHDLFTLATGLTSPTGAGTLNLSAVGDTLAVTLVNGFSPSASFSIPIATYGSLVGGFDLLSVNGMTDGGNTYDAGTGTYSIVHDVNTTSLVFTIIPEPASLALLVVGGLCLLPRRQTA